MTPKVIQFSDALQLPLDACVQKFAFLARSGAGKTYAAGVFVEGLYDLGAQVVIVDPVGVWWGLRLAADGKKPGLPIPVFGGQRGDVPLEPASGELVANLIAGRKISCVLDVSEFTGADQRRFVAAFATALLHAKKKHRSPVMIVWEECQDFVPQKVSGESAKMVGAMERLIKQGRNFGIGTTLISQRPQAVNKDVLNQTEVLVVLQTTGPHERKAIEGWIVDKGLDEAALASIPSLPIGTAYLWSPQWLRKFARIKISRKRTYDASATPEFNFHAAEPRELAPVDLENIRKEMAETIERTKQDDPRELRRQINQLRCALTEAKYAAERERKPAKIERIEVPVFNEKALERAERIATRMKESAAQNIAEIAKLVDEVRRVRALAERPAIPDMSKVMGTVVRPAPRAEPRAARVARADQANGLKKGARAMLAVMRDRNPLSREWVAVLACISHRSGTFSTYWSQIRAAGLVEMTGANRYALTPAGVALVDAEGVTTPNSAQELIEMWSRKFKSGARNMLRVLTESYPEGMNREQLGNGAGISSASGTFSTYLSQLRNNGVVEHDEEGRLRAAEALYA